MSTDLRWLDAAFEHFMNALEAGDYEMCEAVIADTASEGFTREAELLQAKLLATPIRQFARILSVENLIHEASEEI